MIINLSLVSHTNIGKTSLARTLLRRDIGQAVDQAHVTDTAEAHELVSTKEGDALLLWDTPGMGDSARLLKRLIRSADASGWLLTQVWDRWIDRPFFSSQLAMRAVREHCDVVLYLVNAAESPASAGYVAIEMQILAWMDKPILVLLNQTGPSRGTNVDADEENAWRDHLASYPLVREVLSLDAFTRCWLQEDQLFVAVNANLPLDKRQALQGLRNEWKIRNISVYERSISVIASQLFQIATDSEKIAMHSWAQRLRIWLSAAANENRPEVLPKATAVGMDALAFRLDAAIRESTDELIRLHGLSGEAAAHILARVAGQFTVEEAVNHAKAGLIGAALTGALGGLAADLAAGGLSFGAGSFIGGVIGLLGATGAAKAYNHARGGEHGQICWSSVFLTQRFESAVLRYLAVAHFGRGRGQWENSQDPSHWPAIVHETTMRHHDTLDELWHRLWSKKQSIATAYPRELETKLNRIVRDVITAVLTRFYPNATAVFDDLDNKRR